MCRYGLCHGDDGIQKHFYLRGRKSGLCPVLGPPADSFVLQG
jgi:hypothetical protein